MVSAFGEVVRCSGTTPGDRLWPEVCRKAWLCGSPLNGLHMRVELRLWTGLTSLFLVVHSRASSAHSFVQRSIRL